jgi:hypothetical protein
MQMPDRPTADIDIVVAAADLDRAKLMLAQGYGIVQTELGSFCFRYRGRYHNIDLVADVQVGIAGIPGEIFSQHVSNISSPLCHVTLHLFSYHIKVKP